MEHTHTTLNTAPATNSGSFKLSNFPLDLVLVKTGPVAVRPTYGAQKMNFMLSDERYMHERICYRQWNSREFQRSGMK